MIRAMWAMSIVLAAFAATAEAANYEWRGGASQEWTNPANWVTDGQPGTFPNGPDDVVTFPFEIAAPLTVTIAANTQITVRSIVVLTNGAGITIAGAQPDASTSVLRFASPADTPASVSIGGTNRLELRLRVLLAADLHAQIDGVSTVIFERVDQEFIPPIVSNRSITLHGSGLSSFLGPNTYTGATTITSGQLRLENPAGESLAGPLVIGDGQGERASATVRVLGEGQIASVPIEVKSDGFFDVRVSRSVGPVVVTDGLVRCTAPSVSIASLTMTGGSLEASDDDDCAVTGTFTATASNVSFVTVSGNGSLSLLDAIRTFRINDGPGELDLQIAVPVVGAASAGLVKEGAGTMRFVGNRPNTYPGVTRVDEGRLQLARDHQVIAIPGPLVVGTDGRPAIVEVAGGIGERGNIATTSAVSVGPGGIFSADALERFARLHVAAGGHVLVNQGATALLAMAVTMAGGGRISIAEGTRLSVETSVTATSSETQPAVIDGAGRIQLIANTDLTVGDGPYVIDLAIAAAVHADPSHNLFKRGPGVLLFAPGSRVVGGSTTMTEGTLLVTTTNVGVVSPIALRGGTLGGTGLVNAVSASGGRIAPGLSPGLFTAGPITLSAATEFAVELNGAAPGTGYDQLAVRGTVSLNNATLTVTAATTQAPGATFIILDNDGTDAVDGTFAGLPERARVTAGDHAFTISYRGGDGNDVVLTAEREESELTYYLAEGATGTFFDDDVLIANPNDTPAPVTLTFLREGGSTITAQRTVPPQSRLTVHVDDIPGLSDSTASVRVVSTDRLPLVVERSMFWDDTYYGGHTATAVARPETRWIFAEGYQGFFDTYLLLANANDTATTVTLTFLREAATPVVKTVPVAPFARKTVWAGEYPELVNHAFGVVVEATQPVIAERAMYFASLPDRLWTGGHVSTGIVAPATSWFHAEGATGTYFTTFILLSNPQETPAQVELRFLLETGEVITRTKKLGARQRLTINPAEEGDPRLRHASVSTLVQADVPIVSERSMYWPGLATPFGEGHNSAGVTSTALRWGLAEGRAGGPRAFTTYILLANPSAAAAEVTITYLRESGAPIVRTYTVPATSRFNVDVGAVVPELRDASFGARIDVTNNVPIAVERSLYWSANGVLWEGGSNALATPLP